MLFLPILFILFEIFSWLFSTALLVKLTDNRFTCLTNTVKIKHSLTSPVKMELHDDSHHFLWCFIYIVKIRFTHSNHLFLFSHLFVKISNSAFKMYFMSMSYFKFHGLLHCLPLRKFECSTDSEARVSKVHFRVYIFLCFSNPVHIIIITGLLVFSNFFPIKIKNFWKGPPDDTCLADRALLTLWKVFG